MKKIIIVLCLTMLFSCDYGEYHSGDFVYYADAAVLQTSEEVYGVIINKKAEELAQKAKAFQTGPTDMVRVEVSGFLIAKDSLEEGWPFKLDIKKIISVRAVDTNDNQVIKIEKQTE